MGGWVGFRAGMDVVVERRIPIPCRDSNPFLWKEGMKQSFTHS
jgi:hypothetical protein